LIASGVYLASSVALAAWLLPAGRESSPIDFAKPQERADWPSDKAVRTTAIRQARVLVPPDAKFSTSNLAANPPDPSGLLSQPIVRCRYLDGPARGTTAKFDCVLPDGEVIKVKYPGLPSMFPGRSHGSGEIHAEFAATRILTALGFGADRMYMVPRVRCYGCVRTPYYTTRVLDAVHAREWFARTVPEDSYTDFEWVTIERRFEGAEITDGDEEGWPWFELDAVDTARGATRAERDALRLAALLLAHWDNKASNQRLLCLAEPGAGPAPCPRPFAFIQDLGATFGPNKVKLDHWTAAPIWADPSRCTVSMRQFPYSGGTFQDTEISEEGRQLIVRQLVRIGEPELTALFTAARFPEFHGGRGAGADPRTWAQVFLDKARQIADGGPCPTSH
jgi:hypothetical protein